MLRSSIALVTLLATLTSAQQAIAKGGKGSGHAHVAVHHAVVHHAVVHHYTPFHRVPLHPRKHKVKI